MKRLFTLTMFIGAFGLASCEETEYKMPQTLRFEIDGQSYSSYYDASQQGGAGMLDEHVIEIGQSRTAEMIVMPGDSVYLFVSDASTPFEPAPVNITVTLDGKIIETGDTRETGFYILKGRLGQDLFETTNQ